MKKLFALLTILLATLPVIAQQLPLGECGIVYIYDAAGNRTKRVYFCHNGSGPYPSLVASAGENAKQLDPGPFTKAETDNMLFQSVDALYPNPTSGIFYITFSKALDNAMVKIYDANGKAVQQFKASGYKLTANLSALAAGTYFIKIEENGVVISKKIIKR